MPDAANVTCTGHVNGQPHRYDSRHIATVALQRFHDVTGLHVFLGLEPEFFLLRPLDSGGWGVATSGESLAKPCYDYRNLTSVTDYLKDLHEALSAADIDVYQIDHEDANGQFEVNFAYDHALITADRLIFFKIAAQAIARKHGFLCSFMPKPFADRAGSGMHAHISAGRVAGENAFADQQDPRGLGLSATAYAFLGGLLKHADALTALAAPTVNSYRRLVKSGSRSGATWAPVRHIYGNNNRTAFVRVPADRLELRVPDMASNPYLLTAAIVYAGLDGIRHNLNPGEPCNENVYRLSDKELIARGIRAVPCCLELTLDALELSEVMSEGFGADFLDLFVKLKRAEADELSRDIPPKEFDLYIDFF